MHVPLSTDLKDDRAIPYFLWDEPLSVGEFRRRLSQASAPERARLLGKLLREARDTDVWVFTTPWEVVQEWSRIAPHLGRRRAFWQFLFGRWKALRLLDG